MFNVAVNVLLYVISLNNQAYHINQAGYIDAFLVIQDYLGYIVMDAEDNEYELPTLH